MKYALDPHSGTHDVTITNNWVHDNPLGIIVQIKYSSRLSTHSRKTDKTFGKHFNQHWNVVIIVIAHREAFNTKRELFNEDGFTYQGNCGKGCYSVCLYLVKSKENVKPSSEDDKEESNEPYYNEDQDQLEDSKKEQWKCPTKFSNKVHTIL